jgi:predicted enzyme related to lactoylglutathione lyase
VESLDAVEKAVRQYGGRITMPRVRIENVGDLIYFEDTEGNRIGAMQYHPSYNLRG